MFRLPQDQAEHDAAMLGRDALGTLHEIDMKCRDLLKHDYMASEEVREFAQEVRDMIDGRMLEA